MFGRKPPNGPNETPRPVATPVQTTAPRPVAPAIPARAVSSAETDGRPAPAQPVRRPAEPVRVEPPAPVHEVRKLIVGRGIAFSGEISACDDLIVEGTVEARLPGGHRIEITESGLFRGTVEIDEADIGGRFEGDIIVKNRLTVRSTGRIEGKIHYGELAVEAGGVLQGDVHGIGDKAKAAAKPTVRAAEVSPAPSASTSSSSTSTSSASPLSDAR